MLRTFEMLGMGCLAGALALGGCDWTKPKVPGATERAAERKLAGTRALKRACGSAETYDRLKALVFDEVGKLHSGAPQLVDRIAANATIRMEQPHVTSRDEALDITVCQGHLIVDLPPGLQDAFNGNHRLEADVEYSAQAAADGSGLVYQIKGAEPIIYRLAALTLPKGEGQLAGGVRDLPPTPARATAAPAPVAAAQPAAPAPAPPVQPAPAPAPVARAPLPRPAPPVAPRPAPPRIVTRAPDPVPAPRLPPPDVTPEDDAPRVAARPSFPCAAVTSRVLIMICSDPGLAARDRRMSSAYYQALASGDEGTRAALRASRDRFLAFRGRCGSAACIAQSYDDRIAEIGDIARGR